MKPFLALVAKDLKLYFNDRRAVILTLAVPIMIATFFGSLFGGRSGQSGPRRIPIQLVNLDTNELTTNIVAQLSKDPNLDVALTQESAARDLVQRGKAAIAIILPAGFGESATRTFFVPGAKPEITVLHDPSHTTEVGMVNGILTQHVMEIVSREAFSGPAGRRSIQEALAQLSVPGVMGEDSQALREMLGSIDKWMGRGSSTNSGGPAVGGIRVPFTTRTVPLTRDNKTEYNGYAHSFAGMSVQFILMAAIEFGVGILLERQRGLWRRPRAAPLSRGILLGSKAASIAIISMITMSVAFVFACAVFGVRIQGSFLGFLLCMVGFCLFSASVGLLLAALGRTPAATRGLALPVVLIMVMLGGAWVPAFIFPPWLQKITLALPTRWAVDCLDAVTWRGLGLNNVILHLAGLFGVALGLGTVAVLTFNWETE
jgi:ABC-2 type transport system permease protein